MMHWERGSADDPHRKAYSPTPDPARRDPNWKWGLVCGAAAIAVVVLAVWLGR